MRETGDREQQDGDAAERGDADDTGNAAGDDYADALTDSQAVERRVWRNILGVIAVAVLAAAIFAELPFILGLILGGGLALLNYRWLHSSLRAILGTGSAHTPPGTSL